MLRRGEGGSGNCSGELRASDTQRQRSEWAEGPAQPKGHSEASSVAKAGQERTGGHKLSMVRWAGSRQSTQGPSQRPVSDVLVYFRCPREFTGDDKGRFFYVLVKFSE